MPAQLRPLVESLEGRMMLSLVSAGAAATDVLNFGGTATAASAIHALASQQASSVTLTLHRSNDLGLGAKYDGPIQVEVTTGPIPGPSTPVGSAQPEVSSLVWGYAGRRPATSVAPATPGVQYEPVDETISIPAGVTSVPVTIPIVAGAVNPGILSFEVTATVVGIQPVPDGGQTTEDVFLAQNASAAVPRIDGARIVANGRNTSEFVLHFSQPMDPASVQNRSAYSLIDLTTHPTGGFDLFSESGGWISASVVLKKAVYNPSSNTVRLILAKPVPAGDGYQISQPFASNGPLLDAAGTPINEDGTGYGGGFMVTLTSKKATIYDGVDQTVIAAKAQRR